MDDTARISSRILPDWDALDFGSTMISFDRASLEASRTMCRVHTIQIKGKRQTMATLIISRTHTRAVFLAVFVLFVKNTAKIPLGWIIFRPN